MPVLPVLTYLLLHVFTEHKLLTVFVLGVQLVLFHVATSVLFAHSTHDIPVVAPAVLVVPPPPPHTSHVLLPAELYVPTGHLPQYLPVRHPFPAPVGVADVPPSLLKYPAFTLEQLDAPAALYLPAPHTVWLHELFA